MSITGRKMVDVYCENYTEHGSARKVSRFSVRKQVVRTVPAGVSRVCGTRCMVGESPCWHRSGRLGSSLRTSIRPRNLDTAIHGDRNRRFSRFALAR
jgi:hypothetical protein